MALQASAHCMIEIRLIINCKGKNCSIQSKLKIWQSLSNIFEANGVYNQVM
jgi:hypothetical protein